ncbi:hypothetical protein TNCV_4261351 [Trichonephila clavipes]|nr:hypothetical protein TNCV_4261351 [Trichonephila clavipes]
MWYKILGSPRVGGRTRGQRGGVGLPDRAHLRRHRPPSSPSHLEEDTSIGGSVVECSPATRAARVRFPADAEAK